MSPILTDSACMLIFELMGENGSPMLVIWGPCALEGGMDGWTDGERRREMCFTQQSILLVLGVNDYCQR